MRSPALAFRRILQRDLALSLVQTFFVWFTAVQLAVATIAGLAELSRLF
jgi:hypothetical protein